MHLPGDKQPHECAVDHHIDLYISGSDVACVLRGAACRCHDLAHLVGSVPGAGAAPTAWSGVAGSTGKLAADGSDDATLNAPDAADWNAVWLELHADSGHCVAP